jgi:hypothetical protein
MDERNQKDMMKRQLCRDNGITLVEVPYWWDRKYESLVATVYSQSPDLFRDIPKGDPIPKEEPKEKSLEDG